MVSVTPVDENSNDVFDIESLLGPTLIKSVKGSPVPTAKDALKSNKSGMVALYFSASWCPPCQRFTPILADFYNAAKEADCGFDIVFVSSDRGAEEFETYVSILNQEMMLWIDILLMKSKRLMKMDFFLLLYVSYLVLLSYLALINDNAICTFPFPVRQDAMVVDSANTGICRN